MNDIRRLLRWLGLRRWVAPPRTRCTDAPRHIMDSVLYPLGHVLESTADNKLNNGVCPHCNKWFGGKLRAHIEESHR